MKKIKEMSVEELVKTINDAGYSNIGCERALELEFGILDKWISGEEDITCVGLTLLRMLAKYPWMVEIADNNFKNIDDIVKNI